MKLNPSKIVEGGARGADEQARRVAKELGIEVITVNPEWDKYGKAAGPIRNERMITEYKPDLVLAFHSNINSSRGTKNMITLAEKYKIPVKLVSERQCSVCYQTYDPAKGEQCVC